MGLIREEKGIAAQLLEESRGRPWRTRALRSCGSLKQDDLCGAGSRQTEGEHRSERSRRRAASLSTPSVCASVIAAAHDVAVDRSRPRSRPSMRPSHLLEHGRGHGERGARPVRLQPPRRAGRAPATRADRDGSRRSGRCSDDERRALHGAPDRSMRAPTRATSLRARIICSSASCTRRPKWPACSPSRASPRRTCASGSAASAESN